MKIDNFRSALRLKPFQPFGVHTADGEVYSVSQPEAAWASPNGDIVIIAASDGGVAMLGTEHITGIVVPAGTRAGGRKPLPGQ